MNVTTTSAVLHTQAFDAASAIALALMAGWFAGLAAVVRQVQHGTPWTMIGHYTPETSPVRESRWVPLPEIVFDASDDNALPDDLRDRLPPSFTTFPLEARRYPSGKVAFRIILPDGYYYCGLDTVKPFVTLA